MTVQNKLTLAQVHDLTRDIPALEQAIGIPFEQWAHQCHAISLALLKTGRFGYGRIARGTAEGVFGQHSWIVLSHDVYDPQAIVIDPVLWSYDEDVTGIWTGRNLVRHFPKGYGNIWQCGPPQPGNGIPVELTPREPLSRAATAFLEACGPLDMRGWMDLVSNLPMQGWPAGEIVAAIDDTQELRAVTPIDILGMVTDRNPNGLYLRDEDEVK
jgi:hypothetical protein